VAEIETLGRHLRRQPVTHLHWGGGTPSILSIQRIIEIAEALGRSFDMAAVKEHAIELDPRYVNEDLVKCLVRIGVNRVSFGVQDLSPHVQQAIGRIQSYETVTDAVGMVRDTGISNINIDVMYGLPQQTVEDVRATAARVCALKPTRIALFGYAHVPWFKKRQRLIDESRLPDSVDRLNQLAAAREVFLSAGYEAIGFDHFAAPDDDLAVAARSGNLRRNFQGYTVDSAETLIGIGASSIGRLPQGYVQNDPGVAGYLRAVMAGSFATVRGVALSQDDRLRAGIIERIMCDLSVDLNGAAPAEGCSFDTELTSLRPLADAGLVEIADRTVRVTERGRPYLRLVAAAFDAYLPASKSAHSRAV
jgi:oxygen-independent coproporphyrinogen-3 oxidase